MNEEEQIEEMADIIENSITTDNMGYIIHFDTDETSEALYKAGYRKASDVARKIFAEIEKLMLDGEIGGKYPAKVVNPDKYADLKKKYESKGVVTNREYLSKLDTQKLVEWILYESVEIGRMSNNSPLFLAEWLDSKYEGWITIHERSKMIAEMLESEDTK